MQRELTARRDEIQNALVSMQGILTADQTRALQYQLAQMNDALERARMESQEDMFATTTGLNAQQLAAQIDRWNRGLPA